jgi:two-component system, OmpR family, phosphate regulon sensor histidine kinase PhoR
MAGPDSLGFLSFRRTFTLLIFLVVLPSAALSGFGVLAIINERAAVEKRLETIWSAKLLKVRDNVVTAIETATFTTDSLQIGGANIPLIPFQKTAEGVRTAEPALKLALASMGAELDKLPARTVIFSLASPGEPLLVVAGRHGSEVVGGRLDERAQQLLLESLSQEVVPEGEAKLALVHVKRESPEGLVQRLVTGVSEAKAAALGPVAIELASVAMMPSMQDFRLVAWPVGEDPIQVASTRNRWWYGILLTIFYVILVLGVIFTGRTLYRDAKLSRMKTDFVSLVSHELRTPLTSIRMFIEMLATKRVTDEQQMLTVMDLLSKETARLSSMIEAVLDWSRIESGRKHYQKDVVPVDAVIDDAITAFRTQHLHTKYELDIVKLAGARVAIDREAIAGALLNLLSNAIKYTNEPKLISLSASAHKKWIQIGVKDNGIGIEKKDLKRIFERFYRADTLLSRSTEGTGLGLSIARRIVEAHGGKMTVSSTLGQGSVFVIHLKAEPHP